MSDFESLIQLFEKININTKIKEHKKLDDPKEWYNILQQVKNDSDDFNLTKTLILKPKTSVNDITLVIIFALESSNFQLSSIAKSLGFKDFRFATKELISSTFNVDANIGIIIIIYYLKLHLLL